MGWGSKHQHWQTNQETVILESRPLSSSQKGRIFCVWTQDTEDVEKSTPSHLAFPQQETLLTLITPSQESTSQEVENILYSKRWGNESQYLVKCQGQPFEQSTWEDQWEVIRGAAQLCQEFHRSHPDAPGIPTIRIPGKLYSEVARTSRLLRSKDADHVRPYLE